MNNKQFNIFSGPNFCKGKVSGNYAHTSLCSKYFACSNGLTYVMVGHPNLVGLVLLTARNHCLDVLRKKNQHIEEILTDTHFSESQSGLDSLEWRELTDLIQNILKEIPKQQCSALLLRDIDGYEYQEIATVLGINIEHVRVLVSRARKRVAIELKEMQYYEN